MCLYVFSSSVVSCGGGSAAGASAGGRVVGGCHERERVFQTAAVERESAPPSHCRAASHLADRPLLWSSGVRVGCRSAVLHHACGCFRLGHGCQGLDAKPCGGGPGGERASLSVRWKIIAYWATGWTCSEPLGGTPASLPATHPCGDQRAAPRDGGFGRCTHLVGVWWLLLILWNVGSVALQRLCAPLRAVPGRRPATHWVDLT